MKAQLKAPLALAFLLALPGISLAGALSQLSSSFNGDLPAAAPAPVPAPAGNAEAQQWLPADNDEPGFEWRKHTKYEGNPYIFTGDQLTYLGRSDDGMTLAMGAAQCALQPATKYELAVPPVFKGQYITVELAQPLEGCATTKGDVYMASVDSTSAGGLWELPVNVRAFLDTIAYAEGTKEQYNYIYTFEIFTDYSAHPNRKICSGGLCSTAAGRYQFLTKTWKALSADLSLTDFTPASQDKATVELIRRAHAYTLATKASKYANFSAAITKINGIWASLPGSPYGQPTRTMAQLWAFYKTALAKHQ